MGFWDNVFNAATAFLSPRVEYYGARSEELEELIQYAAKDPRKLPVAQLWKGQPHLRTVVSFLARNTAQLGLHVYKRTGDDSRERDRTSPLALMAAGRPNGQMTMFDLIFALVGDKKLYDRAYWLIRHTDDGPQLWRIPPSWVTVKKSSLFEVEEYLITSFKGKPVSVPPQDLVVFGGYHPNDPLAASPAVEALKDTLYEQMQAALYRSQVWRNGGRASAVLERPQGAKWSAGARDAFRDDWYAKWTGDGSHAGGTPILEDGMTLKRIDFSAQDQQFVEASKLAMSTVAGVFHVNPTMVGVLDNANYSNVKEFRKALYAETLGPDLVEIQSRINAFLLPALGMDPAVYYAEFNVQAKLQGDFEEQAAAMAQAIGRPWMAVDEGRSRLNLPHIDGGEGLAIPMAVSLYGELDAGSGGRREDPLSSGPEGSPDEPKALPPGMPSAKGGSAPRRAVKARADDTYERKYEELMMRHFERQRKSIMSKLGAKADWWDGTRWDRELGHDLAGWGLMTTEEVANEVLADSGVEYDVSRTTAWVTKVSKNSAVNINRKTREAVQEMLALVEDDEEVELDEEDFDTIFGLSRAELLGIAAVTTMSAFATQEAGKQGGAVTKTWITGSNPRPEHAAMDGETVAIDDNFSNGLAWPGDASADVEDLAGCNCDLQMNW